MSVLSLERRSAKLERLREIEGFDSHLDMFEAALADSVCPAICIEPECDYTAEMEPDQDRGYCEACGKTTVQSVLILAGLI